MIKSLFKGFFVEDLAIDLSSGRLLIFKKGTGVIINEPSILALDGEEIRAIGESAASTRGKAPEGFRVENPIINGVIADPDNCEKILRYFIKNIYKSSGLLKFYPKITILAPHHATPSDMKVFEETIDSAGARDITVMPSLVAAAYGVGLKANTSSASIICNISRDFTEVGIVSLNKIHYAVTIGIGYDDFVKAIISYVRGQTEYSIGVVAAETVLNHLGTCYYLDEEDDDINVTVSGMYKRMSVPADVVLSKSEVHVAILPCIEQILHGLLEMLEEAKEGMAQDLRQNGITVVGVGAGISRIDRAISEAIHIKANVPKNYSTAIVEGGGFLLNFSNSKERISN